MQGLPRLLARRPQGVGLACRSRPADLQWCVRMRWLRPVRLRDLRVVVARETLVPRQAYGRQDLAVPAHLTSLAAQALPTRSARPACVFAAFGVQALEVWRQADIARERRPRWRFLILRVDFTDVGVLVMGLPRQLRLGGHADSCSALAYLTAVAALSTTWLLLLLVVR